jgi:hypothetical protein
VRDWRGSADVKSMSWTVLTDYGRSCGEVLARFAQTYAAQNQCDYESLRAAVGAGRATAQYDL